MFYLVSTQNAHPLNFEFRVKKGEGVLFLLILATTARPYPNPTLFVTLYKKRGEGGGLIACQANHKSEGGCHLSETSNCLDI